MVLDLGTVWAILGAVVFSMALGFLWYGPLLGKPWMKAMGWEGMSPEQLKAKQGEAMPGYIASIVGAVVAVVVLDFLVTWSFAGGPYSTGSRWLHGLVVGFSGWLVFHLIPNFVSQFFETRNWTLWGIGVAYWGVLALGWGFLVGLLA